MRLNAVADELHVTSSALRWRLVALGEMKPSAARSLPDVALRNNGRDPALPSSPFVEALALAGGHISFRRVGRLLAVEGLANLFAAHGVAHSVDP